MKVNPNMNKVEKERKEVLKNLSPQQVKMFIEKRYSQILRKFPFFDDEVKKEMEILQELVDVIGEQKDLKKHHMMEQGITKSLFNELKERTKENQQQITQHFLNEIVLKLETIDDNISLLKRILSGLYYSIYDVETLILLKDDKTFFHIKEKENGNMIVFSNEIIKQTMEIITKTNDEVDERFQKLFQQRTLEEWEEEFGFFKLVYDFKQTLESELEGFGKDGFQETKQLEFKEEKEQYNEMIKNKELMKILKSYGLKLKEPSFPNHVKYDMKEFNVLILNEDETKYVPFDYDSFKNQYEINMNDFIEEDGNQMGRFLEEMFENIEKEGE